MLNKTIDNNDEKYVSLPYNRKNILITEEDVESLLSKFGIMTKVYDIDLFRQSLTHKSYIEKNFDFDKKLLDECEDYTISIPLQKKSYEMLEFYGDSIADKYVRRYLCNRYDKEDEGTLTKLKTNIVDTKSFAKFARVLGLTPYIIISKQVEGIDNGLGRSSDEFRKILEDVFEAFLAAIEYGLIDLEEYNKKNNNLDEFIEFKKTYKSPCEKLIIYLLESQVDFAELLYNDTNYKNRLLQHYHKMQWGFPVYGEEHHDGPAHKREFVMYVLDNENNKIGFGSGKRKKDGEQIAARNALIKLGVIDECEEENTINIMDTMFV